MLFVLSLFFDLLGEVLNSLVMSLRPKAPLAAEKVFLRRRLALHSQEGDDAHFGPAERPA